MNLFVWKLCCWVKWKQHFLAGFRSVVLWPQKAVISDSFPSFSLLSWQHRKSARWWTLMLIIVIEQNNAFKLCISAPALHIWKASFMPLKSNKHKCFSLYSSFSQPFHALQTPRITECWFVFQHFTELWFEGLSGSRAPVSAAVSWLLLLSVLCYLPCSGAAERKRQADEEERVSEKTSQKLQLPSISINREQWKTPSIISHSPAWCPN